MSSTATQSAKRAGPAGPRQDYDSHALAARLKRVLEGEVRFDDGSRALYATDASNYRQVPIGVVIPRSENDVLETLAACREAGAPLLCRGAGTSLAGQCCNVAVVMDFTKYMNRVLGLDLENRLAIVEPGCVLDDLRSETNKHGLTLAPDPATHTHCSLGGMLGNNACGIHSLLAQRHGLGQRMSDNTRELEIVTYNGEQMRVGPTSPEDLNRIIRQGGAKARIYAALKRLRDDNAQGIRELFPKLPRRVSGYNLDELLPENGFQVARSLVGTEGTCVTILKATVHLVPRPAAHALLLLGYPDVFAAGRHLMEILEFKPTGLEGLDHILLEWLQEQGNRPEGLKLFPQGHGWLLVEFGGDTREDAAGRARQCAAALSRGSESPSVRLLEDPEEQERVWQVRESGLAATAWQRNQPDKWPGFEDSSVPPEKIADYLVDLQDLMRRYDYKTSLYGHFGQGCVHCRIAFDLYSAEGLRKYESFMDEATDLVVRYGGSFSGEHGDGQARAQFLQKLYGPELVQSFRDFKGIWDPDWKMNPGKVVDADPITANLRLGTDYNPPDPPTHFAYAEDGGTFARATLRCVGVGKCRVKSGQTMCPSYMVTRDEMHSTRGRARLLWEMLNSNALQGGWRNEAVHEALDLCLACKGCKGDCPVQVDMATYKSEFLAHHYKGRLRPRQAYAFGLIPVWARLASLAPVVANLFTGAPLLGSIAKWLVRVAPERRIPPFAPQTFQAWFHRRCPGRALKPEVILWADTFHNHFYPQVAKAAVQVLEAAGFNVEVPRGHLCCGRPLYDFGMLSTAKRWLREILTRLRAAIEAGTPVVVLEPSCYAVFKDEMLNLFPNDVSAQRLARNTFLLSEFLEKKAPDYEIPQLNRNAIVHGHCHHKAITGLQDEEAVLRRLGLNARILQTGCCGMAGAFGYEKGNHYEVSIACGEQSLLPEVRQAEQETLVIANGFSCREQIAQATDREPLHLAQVIEIALQEGSYGRIGEAPEKQYIQERRAEYRQAVARTAAAVAGLAAAAIVTWKLWSNGCRRPPGKLS